MNPTNDVLEKRIAALEGGLSCVTVSSGQTASTFSVLNVAQAGDNIVSSTDLYGGTVSLFTHTLSKLELKSDMLIRVIQKTLKNLLMTKPEPFMERLCQIHI